MYRGLVVLVVAFSLIASTASAQGRGGGRGGGAAAPEAPRVLGPAPPLPQQPAGFVQPARCGRDAHLSAHLTFPRLAREGEICETRLGLVYLNNTVGVVALLRVRKGEETLGEIHVMSQPDIVGPVSVERRSFQLKEDLPAGEWTLAVRAGALAIACNGKELGRASLETGTTPIRDTTPASAPDRCEPGSGSPSPTPRVGGTRSCWPRAGCSTPRRAASPTTT